MIRRRGGFTSQTVRSTRKGLMDQTTTARYQGGARRLSTLAATAIMGLMSCVLEVTLGLLVAAIYV